MTLKTQLEEIWNRPGCAEPGHLCIWKRAHEHTDRLEHSPGSKRRPAWDKALLKRARLHLPNWFSNKSKPY